MDVKELEGRLKTIPKSPERLEALEDLAGYYFDHDDYSKAVRYYAEAAELAPTRNLRAYYLGQKGTCHYLLHRDGQAARDLLAAREMFEATQEDFVPEVYGMVNFFLGSLFEYNGDHQSSLQARLQALKYLADLPQDAQWMLLAGMSRNYEEQGDHRRAIELSNQAISLIGHNDPELAYLYEGLAINHYELGEYQKALAYFSKVLEIDANFERKDEIYFSIGLCYQRLQDYRTALRSYLKILELKELSAKPESLCWLYIEIAHCYYQLKEHKKSLEFVERALQEPIEDQEELAEIRSYLTNNYYALGRYTEAVAEGEKTLKISSHFHDIEIMLTNLALSYYHLNQKKKFDYYRDWCNRAFPENSWTRHLNKLAV